MYLWKVDRLVADLQSNQLTAKEEFKYLLISSVSITALSIPIEIASATDLSYIGFFGTLLITIFNIYYSYNINASGDNKDFIKRSICLSVPITIRLLPIVILLLLIDDIINTPSSYYENPDQDFPIMPVSVTDIALEWVLTVIYFAYFCIKLKAVALYKPSLISE